MLNAARVVRDAGTAPDGTVTTGRAPERWLVRFVDAPGDIAPVCDYFRRLGASAQVSGPTEVEIPLTPDFSELDLQAFAASWTTANGIRLDVRRRVEAVPQLRPPRLGELLLRKGLVTQEQLDWGLERSKATGDLLGVVLTRAGVIFEEEVARTLSDQLSIPYISIGRVGIDRGATALVPVEVGLAAAAIPVRIKGDSVQVAFADPTDQRAIDLIDQHVRTIDVAVGELSEITTAWHEIAARRFSGGAGHAR